VVVDVQDTAQCIRASGDVAKFQIVVAVFRVQQGRVLQMPEGNEPSGLDQPEQTGAMFCS
jgi:hypothetical protein